MTRVAEEMNRQIANYIRGKGIEILICGVATYIAFIALGLNYAALLALLVGLSVVVPYVGAVVVTVPVTLIALFQWGWGDQFIYLMAVYAIIQALDGNVLVPLLFSEAVSLHPVAIICAVLLFGGLWGFWGIFFAIPLATLFKAHRFHMPGHLHAAPFLAQHTLAVDQERAAVHPHVFLAVQLLELDHVEQLAQGFVLVADQLEREALLGLEVL
uniref:AI-2E family transporter n=1 Tax=Steinernema glaseri TaxID=37863 RepID=A0A1I8AEP5_9BILA